MLIVLLSCQMGLGKTIEIIATILDVIDLSKSVSGLRILCVLTTHLDTLG